MNKAQEIRRTVKREIVDSSAGISVASILISDSISIDNGAELCVLIDSVARAILARDAMLRGEEDRAKMLTDQLLI